MANGSKFVCRALSELKEAGVTIALDDFGTGYSSLSHLRDFPVDIVKIDKSFVQEVAVDDEIAAIVAAVVNDAKPQHSNCRRRSKDPGAGGPVAGRGVRIRAMLLPRHAYGGRGCIRQLAKPREQNVA